jgi:DNA-binding LacI/PurR family transcriptional regulator
MDEGRRPATMRDVAARAGVSRSLVSTVFRGVPGASPETRSRILEAAAELGYRRDDRARHLRSRDRSLVGVTLTAAHPFHVSLVEDLHDAAELRGYELSIALSTESRTLTRAVDTLLAQRCAAIVLVGPTAAEHELARLAAACHGVPMVMADRYSTLPQVDTLRVDDARALALTIDHLVALGHSDIWHIGGDDFVSAAPRRDGYLRAMAAHGLAGHAQVREAGGTEADGAKAVGRMLEEGSLPTALVAYNDRVAYGVIDILWRNQVRVPDDISVVGFDNIPAAALPHLSLTTVEQRADILAAQVVEVLLGRLAGDPAAGLRLIPPGPLVVRGSTTRPRPLGRLRSVAG